MSLAEPTTTLTDYLLASVGVVCAIRLWRARRSAPARWLAVALLATAVAAACGGSSHGFAPALSPATLAFLWSATYIVIGFANLFLLLGVSGGVVASPGVRRVLGAAFVARLAAYVPLLLSRRDFRLVVADYALTLLVVAALAVLARRRRQPAADWLLGAVAVSVAGALVQASRFGFHTHFNHNDLFHLVQTLGLWLFYRAGLRLPLGKALAPP